VTIKKGDTILVDYTGKFEDGEVFDSSQGREPLKFTVGSGQIIKGFDDAVVGMSVGDKKTVTIAATEAYGEHREDHVIDMPKAHIPEGMDLKAGMAVELMDQDRNPIPAVCTEILEDVVRIDVNHPLAGKTLVFDIEVLKTGLDPDHLSCGAGCTECNH
jgi:peptidylprolyl isomerase